MVTTSTKTDMNTENKEGLDKFVEMVKDVRICMLITHHHSENISGRPMSFNKIDADGTMWFFGKASSKKVDELEADKNVSIAVVNEKNNIYLMINGSAELHTDKTKMEELWNPIMKAWFPEGIDDPDMILIKVTPHEINYWENSSSKMVVLFGMLQAIVTGKEYDSGEKGKIDL